MAQFTGVSVGTSEPINLCVGLPLSPIGSIRAGFSASQHSDQIFDTGSTVLFSRFKLSAYYDYLMGICGPSLSFLFEDLGVALANTSNGGQLTLDFSSAKQEAQAGMFMGFSFGGGVDAREQLYLPSSWYSPWKFSWHTVFSASVKVEIDFLELFAELIAYLLEQAAEDALLEKDTSDHLGSVIDSGQTFMFVGEAEDAFPAQKQLTAAPSVTVPINLVDYVPGLDSFVKALHKVKGDLCLGPSFTLAMPVTMHLGSFTVDSGMPTQATYGSPQFGKTTVTATGPAYSGTTPKTLTTNVNYDVGFSIDLGVYFSLSACKIFSFSWQAPSLGLAPLLGFDAIVPTMSGSVSTLLESPSLSCVLVPELMVKFSEDPILTGTPVTVTVSVASPYIGPVDVAIATDPPMPGFPTAVSIPSGQHSTSFTYTFADRCIPSGDPNDPTATESASPTSPTYTVNVTCKATLSPPPTCGSSDISVITAINVLDNVIALALASGTVGPAPPWADQSTGGATINADPSLPAGDANASNTAFVNVRLSRNAPTDAVPVRFTLLDEQRQPHPTSALEVFFERDPVSAVLGPANTLSIHLPNTIQMRWASKGPQVNYSNRFILVVDAGCSYGQSEFWLDLWNWS